MLIDRRRTSGRPPLALVGCGASGMLAAAHLLRAASAHQAPVRVVLIERSGRCGGVAYSTSDPHHRLNVTAARMSALPDSSDDFVHWRTREIGDSDPGAYAGRWEYRRYLEDALTSAQRNAGTDISIARVAASVVRLDPLPTGLRLRLEDGGILDADSAVLALGNPPPLPPSGCADVRDHPAYVNDPWAPGALERLAPDAGARVVLIGTGLTMVDVAITLGTRHPGSSCSRYPAADCCHERTSRGASRRTPARPRSIQTRRCPAHVDAILAASARRRPPLAPAGGRAAAPTRRPSGSA